MRHKEHGFLRVFGRSQLRVLLHPAYGFTWHCAEPSFTLAQLVRLVYSPNARKRSAASSAVEAVLCGHTEQCRTITVLLDCLRFKKHSICNYNCITDLI